MPVPPPPREPTPAARDLIFAYAGRQKLQLIVGTVFVLFGGPMSLLFAWGLPGDLALRVSGQPIKATVVGAHTDESVEINGEHPVVVAFAWEEGGHRREGKTTFTGRSVHDFSAGTTVDAEVVLANPDWAQLKGGTYSTFGLIGLFTLIFPLAGLALVLTTVRGNRNEIRAYRHGVATRGKVVRSEEETASQANGKHPWVVKWEFEVDGQQHQGELTNMTHATLSHLTVGTAVTVLYLREKPKVNTLYLE